MYGTMFITCASFRACFIHLGTSGSRLRRSKISCFPSRNLHFGPSFWCPDIQRKIAFYPSKFFNDHLPKRRQKRLSSSSQLSSSSILLEDNGINSKGVYHRFQIPRKNLVTHNNSCHYIHTTISACKDDKKKIPESEDPSLAYERSGKKYNKGPDQIIPSEAIYTWHSRGAVRISKLGKQPGIIRPPVSIPTLFKGFVERQPNIPAIACKRDGKWIKWTTEEYFGDVQKAAKAFIALGLERHHSVCVLGFNSPEWFIADLGAIFAGGIPAGIYTTNSPASCAYIAKDSKANIYVVEDEQQLSKILQYKDNLPHLKAIIQYKGKPGAEGVLSWEDFMKLGSTQSSLPLQERLEQMAVNQCCTLIYTSGTTGKPKGVMLSHDNITWLAAQAAEFACIDEGFQEVVSFLPLSHIAAQTADIYMPMFIQGTVYFADPDALRGSLINTMREIKPTIFLAVPRVWEKMYDALKEVGAGTKGLKLKLVNWAKEKSLEYHTKKLAGDPNPETFQFKLADQLILSKIREALGLSRAHLCLSAAAPMNAEIIEYFMSLNLMIGEAYGLSECSGPHTTGVPKHGIFRIGSIGKPVDGVASKLHQPQADGQGELCLGGRHVLMGYLNQEEKTRKAVDDEGWLHTEDLARMDSDGYIFITGRLKELLITAGGENVAPVPIEENIKMALPCLSNAMVVGDRLKFLSVLITFRTEMNPETNEPLEKLTPACKKWIEKHGSCSVNTVKDILTEVYEKKNSKLINAIDSGVMLANSKSVSRAQKVQVWKILPKDFSIPGGELGPTLKLKRSVVTDKYKNAIDEIYVGEFDPNGTGCLG